jgi:hypothetical protein
MKADPRLSVGEVGVVGSDVPCLLVAATVGSPGSGDMMPTGFNAEIHFDFKMKTN